MDRNPYAAPESSLETSTQGTVPMMRYGVLCFVALLAIVAAYALASRVLGIPIWQYTGIVGLLASIQLAAWRFVRTHGRVMSRIELQRFALACAVAFWVFDEVPGLITRFLSNGDEVSRAVFTAIVGSAFDVALAVVMVYVTVPPMTRYVVCRMSVSARRSQDGDPSTGARP